MAAPVKDGNPVRSGRRNGSTRISSKHQITLPVEAMRDAGLEIGDVLWAEVEAPGVVRLVSAQNLLTRLAGAHTDLFTEGPSIDELRDAWDR